MKFFNLFLVFFFLFFIGCGDGGVTRIISEAETDGESQNDNDLTEPTDNPTNPTDDPTNPTDDPANPTDDPTNPTDDPTNPTDDPTNPTYEPTNPTDDPTNPTDDPTNPTDDPTNPTEPTVEPDSDEAKCIAAGGIWDAFAEEDFERCYKIVNCELPEGENSEYIVWRSDQSYLEYYDVDDAQWTNFGVNYATEYSNTGEPKICQYICASNAVREDNKCKPLCSANFNGSSSKIIVTHDDKLNLGESWTIEAWMKQDLNSLATKENYIVKKGSRSYFLGGFYKSTEGLNPLSQKNYYNIEGGFYYALSQLVENDVTVEAKYQNIADSPISDGWNHIALSSYIKNGKTILRLYINGKLAKESTNSGERTPKTVDDNLTIGYYSDGSIIGDLISSEYYFNGKIDQLKITQNYYENEFTPSKLYVDDNTIAFYDFSNNAEDSSVNALHGSGTNVTYSTDCAF